MKFRPSHLLLPLVAALALGTLAPAEAAPTDAVGNLTVTQVQGPNHTWQIHATWDTVAGANGYRVWLVDHADGSSSFDYDHKNAASNSADLSSNDLLPGATFYVAVRTLSPDEGDLAVQSFTPITLDTTNPTGSFTLNRTSGLLNIPQGGDPFEDDARADFKITQTALADDSGAPVTRQVVAGDGTAAKAWSTGTAYTLRYLKKGTYTPEVLLTDTFGNVATITLPTITVREDLLGPAIHIKRPGKATKKASWRRIRGTASDSGTGVALTFAMVLEKRGSIWYAYDFEKKTWLKGNKSMEKTLNDTNASPAGMVVTQAGNWITPVIRKLTKGTLHVEAVAIDNAFNFGQARPITQKIR